MTFRAHYRLARLRGDLDAGRPDRGGRSIGKRAAGPITGTLWRALVGTVALTSVLHGQEPTLVEIELVGVGAVIVEARTGTPAPQLPAAEVYAFLGLGTPPTQWVELGALRDAVGPAVLVRWEPERQRILVDDPYATLRPTRAKRDRQRNQAVARGPTFTPAVGPFGSITADERGERMVEAGWSFGRVTVRGATSTVSGEAWSASVSPLRGWWLTYADSDQRGPVATARVALGPVYGSVDWRERAAEPLTFSAAATWGSVAAFVAPGRDEYVLTLRGAPLLGLDFQVARSGDVWSTRIGFGPFGPSPLSAPHVR